jgi:predicted nuclease of predicted toxin-antitoxin system
VKFLVDSIMSTRILEGLRDAGHDAVHAREYGLQRAPDQEILARAAREQPTVLTADMDFGLLLASRHDPWPSVVLLRRLAFHRADVVLTLLLASLPQHPDALEQGSLVVLEERRAAFDAGRSTLRRHSSPNR